MMKPKGLFFLLLYLMGYIMKEYFRSIENLLNIFTKKRVKIPVDPFDEDFLKMMDQLDCLDYEHPAQRSRRSSSMDSDEQLANNSPSYFTKFKPASPRLDPKKPSREHIPYLDLNSNNNTTGMKK